MYHRQKIGFFINPFILYIFTFLLSFLLLSLGWSELFPKQNNILFYFLLFTFLISFVFSFLIKTNYKKLDITISRYGFYFIIFGYFCDFIYAGYIPVIRFILGDLKFTHFGGIPTFHVILVSYNVYYAIRLFQKFLFSGLKKYKIRFLLVFIPSILMFNRGMMVSIILPCLILYIYYKKNFFKVFLFLIVFLYLFGMLGNIRLRSNEEDIFSEMARPSEQFKELKIPTIYLWTYMYVASPLANLSNSMNKGYREENLQAFLFENFIFDFLSKRVYTSNIKYEKYLISPIFNVSSMFFRSYITMGLFGLFIFWSFNVFIVILINRIFSTKSEYALTVNAILSSIMVLNFFSNMWVFSAISFPLIWCIFFSSIRGLRKWFI